MKKVVSRLSFSNGGMLSSTSLLDCARVTGMGRRSFRGRSARWGYRRFREVEYIHDAVGTGVVLLPLDAIQALCPDVGFESFASASLPL
jgi:hypothetical protein